MLTALKTTPLLAALCLLAAAPTFAAGEHDHHHGGGEQGQYSFGSPAQATNTARTIRITANDTPRFVAQDPLVIKKGETIQFVITNAGEHRHEFAVGDRASQRAHALMMKKDPDMKHDADPAVVSIAAGETKTLVWTFDKTPASPIELACHVGDHYAEGMRLGVTLK
jgi:uncharacterized cupredoxin-like copper-binding protein